MQIRDFNIAKREEDVGYYAGFVGELILFFFFSSLTVHEYST